MEKKSNCLVFLTFFFFCALPFLLSNPLSAATLSDDALLSASAESPSLADAVDNDSLVFETGGDANWFWQNTRIYYGGDAAENGDIGDAQESWMKTTMTGPGTINFYWKVSSELGADFLEFYIDGLKTDYLSGTVNWMQQTYLVPTGSHTLTWRYVKNGAKSVGLDSAWVDKITWISYSLVPEVPKTPSGVSASDGAYNYKIRLTWRASAGATSYKVYRAVSPSAPRIFIATRTGTSFEDTTVSCDTKYYYWVRAKNSVGTSGYSNYNSGYIQFIAPAGVSASDGEYLDKIRVTWSASSGATAYEVYRASSLEGGKIKIATITGTSFEDKTAACCNDYYYWVKAKNSKCTTGFSDSDSGHRLPPPPAAPTGVSASDGIFPGEVRVAWNASASAEIYEVYRAIAANGDKTLIASTSNTNWNDMDALCGIYYYWIKAKNSSGTSGYSESDSGFHSQCPPPSPPIGVSATDGAFTDKIRITWNASEGATSYEIYRAETSGGTKVKINTTGSTSYDDYFVNVSKTYYYWVKALKSTTSSDFSLKFDTGYRLCPKPPANVSASDDAYTDRIRITWSASPGAIAYELYRGIYPTAPDNSKKLIATTTATSYEDICETCLSSCAQCSVSSIKYYYWVKAKSADCISGYSAYDTGYTHCKPQAPTGVTATDGTLQNVIRVTWTVTANENQFEVYRSTSPDGEKILLATTPYQSYLDKSVSCSTTYYYWVKRKDIKGFTSDFSAYNAGYCPGN